MIVFFFKQKTAYEMCGRDWSSDVCSSDLTPERTDITFDLSGKTLVLVDDVIFSGRTIRAALNAVTDYGRPEMIQLAVLIDRGHRQLPIHPDFVGKAVPTARHEVVKVFLSDIDGHDAVQLLRRD